MLFLTCDYGDTPDKPPTKFTVEYLATDNIFLEVKVEDHGGSLQAAYQALWEALVKEGVDSVMSSSCIDHLFTDGLLERGL